MTPEDVQAELALTKTQTPTLEELLFTQSLQRFNGADSITGSPAWTFFVAPIKCKILSVALMWEYLNIPVSDTSYWRLTLQKGEAVGGWTDVAARSTQNTGANANGGIVARKAWTFDAAAWGDGVLLPGQGMRIAFSPTGSPPALTFPVCLTGRYSPFA